MTTNSTHPAQSTADGKPGWPEGVRPISMEGLDHVGVGRDGTLYWDGKPIVVRKGIDLTWWQTMIAVVAALGAFASGMTDLLQYLGIKP